MKNLTLIIDIGNTTTIFGVFDNKEFLKSLVTFTHKNSILEKEKSLVKFLYENDFEISKGMIFSVVPTEQDVIKNLVSKVCNVTLKIFDAKSYTDLKTCVDNPKEIGADLIADLVGANSIYGYPNLIVDLGTVNKFLHVDKDGVFDGCSFFPGMQSSLSLFNEKTALLPEIETFNKSPDKLGKNTIDAMNHGVYWSVVSFIKKEQEQFGSEIKLIITGGNCQVIESEIDKKIVDKDLTLKGMNIIFLEADL